MTIYVSHSTNYDYEAELYQPLQQSSLNNDIYYPHSSENKGKNSKDIISDSDLVLAEVSYASTGQGIELGWAEDKSIPIVCFYRSGSKVSGALDAVCSDFIEYGSVQEMISKLEDYVQAYNQS